MRHRLGANVAIFQWNHPTVSRKGEIMAWILSSLVALGLAGLLISGCEIERILTNRPPDRYTDADESSFAQQGGGSVIVDRTGKMWDVSHALNYGLTPDGFQFGLGPFAILPLIDPGMYFPGDSGYPSAARTMMVLGVELNGFVRAYPTWNVMSHIEVANDRFGEAHVAVAF